MTSHPLIVSLLFGGLIAWIGADSTGAFASPVRDNSLGLIDRERRDRRLGSIWYSLFENWIVPLSNLNQKLFSWVIDALDRGDAKIAPFSPSEYMATCEMKGIVCGAVASVIMLGAAGSSLFASFLWGTLVFLTISWYLISGTLRQSQAMQKRIRARLPFTIELIALLMESGGTDILEAIRTAAEENEGHPLGRRLRRLILAESRGMDLSSALRDWSLTYRDEDLIEFAFSIRTSIERGTPLEVSLRALSEQFQQRRMQRLERAAEETKVHITWPGMLVLLACLMIVTAPFILTARDVLGW